MNPIIKPMSRNELFPIFLKTTEFEILLIGGGKVALEKLTFLLKSSPNAKVRVVTKDINEEVQSLLNEFHIPFELRPFQESDLDPCSLVISAIDDHEESLIIHKKCRERNILINVADVPKLCDFYLGGIVTKGNLKMGISTNGKSPTMAKRLRQFFEEVLPENMDETLIHMNELRAKLKGNLSAKTKQLNDVTQFLIEQNDTN